MLCFDDDQNPEEKTEAEIEKYKAKEIKKAEQAERAEKIK